MKYMAEHLPRVGTVTVVVECSITFEVKCVGFSSIELLGSSGSLYTINLPHRVQTTVQESTLRSFEQTKSIRLKSVDLGSDRGLYMNRSLNFMMQATPQRWMKKDLDAHPFSLDCRECGTTLITSERCLRVSEMPSEFWAELMDYWHCHKPLTSDSVGVDRYAKLVPLSGEVLVGSSSFFFGPDWPSSALQFDDETVKCSVCCKSLGHITAEKLYEIKKWDVKLARNGALETFPPELHVATALLNSINANATRIVRLTCEDNSQQLLLWLFAVGINVSYTGSDTLQNCMKVYFKNIEGGFQTDGKSKSQNTDEIKVPAVAYSRFVYNLKEVHSQLPSTVQRLDSWKLSFVKCS